MTQTIRAHLATISFSACVALLAATSHAASSPKDGKHATAQKTSGSKTKIKPHSRKAVARSGNVVRESRRAVGRLKAVRHIPIPRSRPNMALADPINRLLASTSSMLTPPASDVPPAYAPIASSEANIHALKRAIRLALRGKVDTATNRRDYIHDEVSRKLVEWVMLRSGDSAASFARYAAFLDANGAWPSRDMFRRRAEARLWSEKREPGVVLAFFSDHEPLGSLGKLAMARALLAQGKVTAAGKYVRSAWREDNFSAQLEAQVLKTFGSLLTTADHKARMHIRLYANDFDTAMRAAKRLSAPQVAIVKARAAVTRRAKNAGTLLNAVPQAARNDPAYLLTRVQWLRRSGQVGEAAKLMLSAPHDARLIHDADKWWIERRILVREMLDDGKAQIAYRIARNAALPSKEGLRVDHPFTAGWIALRFLNDPRSAAKHFARIPQITTHPTSLARAGYWLGRAAEAAGRGSDARRYYESAAEHSAAYYGQLARARLGRRGILVRRPPALDSMRRAALRNVDLVRAVELLYATGNRDLVVPFVADLNRVGDAAVLTLIAETAARHKDARAMLYLGRSALARGFAFDQYAFPNVGLPKYAPIGPKADKSLVYAIARAESAFNPRVVSAAKAKGLMQVMPATGRTIARRLRIKFDPKRLLNDPSYNVQMGAAEIADLVNTYDGNHVLAFVGYNAGRGRVKEWTKRYGDPRNPNVDVVDWVERIPFTETRIYVQRVMENLQVYRSRFERPARLTIEADMRGMQG
ncbi:murein transglycosylase [Pseudorhodoplanes sinuspersici]|uniref:Murein transglycosylase n=2 Tax=Pseudorhodoplanes sinuspersici TaxID=1235591 RepID=A0A1W6ZME0_9HYPH|nr:murein transglycosylase [Pseudorhodoplanes sinuspersici]